MSGECTCKRCPECGGTGDVWISISGKYLGRFHCDDLDELDTCPDCEGSGIIEMCDSCMEAEEEAMDREWMEQSKEVGG